MKTLGYYRLPYCESYSLFPLWWVGHWSSFNMLESFIPFSHFVVGANKPHSTCAIVWHNRLQNRFQLSTMVIFQSSKQWPSFLSLCSCGKVILKKRYGGFPRVINKPRFAHLFHSIIWLLSNKVVYAKVGIIFNEIVGALIQI